MDKTYNPLPRDVVVRNNRFGKNGWDPKFAGAEILAKAVGGTIPPVMWDGVTSHPQNTDPVRVRLADGPVLNLNLDGPGQLMTAKPAVTPTFGDAAPAEPKPVVLPRRQAALGK